jgi:glycogen debranching enzyme
MDQIEFSLSEKLNTIDLFELLLELLTPDGIQASTWELFQGAIFGRDSERVALDLLPWFPGLSEKVIFSLLRLQGTKSNPVTEEEAGRIHHEYRHLFVGGRKVGPMQQKILRELAEKWGGTEEEVIYYGSVDATPQIIRLVAAYCQNYSPALLNEEFKHRNGTVITVREALLSAVTWIINRIEQSDIGLLEFQHTNPMGIKWQVLRDGTLAYIHENGRIANANAPIASLDVQGLAYDALLYAAELFHKDMPERAAQWQEVAQKIQKNTFERFWLPEERYFAMAIDRDKHGTPRLLKTLTSVQAELLETRIFDSLSQEDKQHYVSSIIEHMYGPDFLTDVGIRSRALRYHELLPYWDYQGSKVCWTVMTNIFAIGLRRQGFLELAEDMENRMLNGAIIAGDWLEFYYVDTDGKVNYFPLEKGQIPTERKVAISMIAGTNIPENTQAWTVSALLRVLLQRDKGGDTFRSMPSAFWQCQTEELIFKAISKTKVLNSEQDRVNALLQSGPFHIDRQEGKRLEQNFLEGLNKFD